MASKHWGDETDPNFELWDELQWVVAQWVCQQRARRKPEPAAHHIENPAADNDPCDWCYDEAASIAAEGLRDLLQAYGSMAYSCGKDGVPEEGAARRALVAMIERSREIEGAKVLLALVAGKDGWWELPLEHDERLL